MHKMTYGRARLLLGITGVGSLVTISVIALVLGLPGRLLSPDRVLGISQLGQLATFSATFMLWLIPLDFLGGYLLPSRFGRSKDSFAKWFISYVPAVIGQAILFIAFGSLILLLSQTLGLIGGLLFVSHINEIAGLLEKVTGQEVFDPTVYYFTEIPTIIHPFTLCWVMAGAVGIAIMASVLPALRAARMHPVQALRFE